MNTISISVQKGGSGKTTTVHNVAAELAKAGKSVLMVDIDPQATLTGICNVDAALTMADVFAGDRNKKKSMAEVIQPIKERLDIAPAGIDLSDTEIKIVNRAGRASILRNALATIQDDYDFCIIDTPPSLSLLTINALTASDGIIIPVQPTAADIWGLNLFLDTLVSDAVNPSPEVIGILLTFFDSRLNLHQNALQQLESAEHLPPVLPMRITRSIKIAEAAGAHLPLCEYDSRNINNKAYSLLAQELIKWQSNRPRISD